MNEDWLTATKQIVKQPSYAFFYEAIIQLSFPSPATDFKKIHWDMFDVKISFTSFKLS